MPKYYSLEVSENNKAELYIFGNITSWPWREKDRDAYGIVKELEALEVDSVDVHINSYGGDVAEGLAIYNVLKNGKAKVTTYCDGFACSAASVIFMAGDERIMNEASLLMIHNAWTYASGDANDFRKQAEDLDKITRASISAYMSRISITEDELKQKMDAETWITANEAISDGFATKILEESDAGKANQSAFKTIRERVLLQQEMIAPMQLLEAEEMYDMDELAGKIAEKVKELMGHKEKQKQETSAGWGAFFNEKERKNVN